MSCDIAPATPAGRVFRVGRAPDPWAWPGWAYVGPDGTFGGRYDDPRGEFRVLYACSGRVGALIETLARFRPDLRVRAGLTEIDGADTVPYGTVPAAWLEGRLMGEAMMRGQLADVGHSRSLRHLREVLADRVLHHGVAELDAAAIRLSVPRRLTQEIARAVFECAKPDGSAQFAGIHYRSRLGDELCNWALFERSEPELEVQGVGAVARDDPDLLAALAHLGLRLSESL